MTDPNSPGDEKTAPEESSHPTSESASQNNETGTPARNDDPQQTVVVRYGAMRQIGEFRHTLQTPPPVGTQVVIRTDRGVELGRVVVPVCSGDTCGAVQIDSPKLEGFLEQAGGDYPFRRGGRLLRVANQQDLIDHKHLEDSAQEAATFCKAKIREKKIAMHLVKVEHLLGGERIVFYFTAEHRVDFRELVRTLAGQFRTRIEMRQVGARDEARLVADYERCGQQCCCRAFLKDLKPVSMRMAKLQKATLDPSKISGRCGRLMCCLRYEDDTYKDLRKQLPRRNTWIRAGDIVGKVLETQTITQLVKLSLPDSTTAVISVEEVTERDIPKPDAEEMKDLARAARRKARPAEDIINSPATPQEQQPPSDNTAPEKETETDSSQKRKKPRKRRRSSRRGGKNKSSQGNNNSATQGSDAQGGEKKKRRSRGRRRRKKKKPDGQGGNAKGGKSGS